MQFRKPETTSTTRRRAAVPHAALLIAVVACMLAAPAAFGQHPRRPAGDPPRRQVDPSQAVQQDESADESQPPAPDRSAAGPRANRPWADAEDLPWQMVEEFFPDQAQRLRALRDSDPAAYARWARRLRPLMRELREANARSPQLARTMVQQHRAEMAIHEWRRRYHAASAQDRPALEAEGQELVRRRIELRLQRQRLEIELLEKRLEELKTALHDRQEHKDDAIEREFSHLKSALATRPARPPGPRGEGRGPRSDE